MVRLISLLFLTTVGCRSRESEIFLIPTGYMGNVKIIYNQSKGDNIKYENGARIYRIPDNGILLTQFKENDDGFLSQKYFYVDSFQNRKEIPVFNYTHDSVGSVIYAIKDSSLVGIYEKGISGVYGNNKYYYDEFTVTDGYNIKVYFSTSYVQEREKKLSDLLQDKFDSVDKLEVK